MGEETSSSSKFYSIPFYELCLKFSTYSIYHHVSLSYHQVFLLDMRVECPNLNLKRSCDSPLNTNFNICCVYWCHYIYVGVGKWLGKYTLDKQDTKNSSVDNVCCITTFLWIILIFHSSHTSLFLENVTVKLGRPRTEPEKNKYPATRQSIIKIMLLIKFQEFFKKMFSCSGAFRLKVYI